MKKNITILCLILVFCTACSNIKNPDVYSCEHGINTVSCLKGLAEKNNMVAQDHLGNMYYEGEKISKSWIQALYWFKKSAMLGYAPAEYKLSLMYYKGQGIKSDPTVALYWLDKSSKQGYAPAQDNLGYIYFKGQILEHSYQKAFDLYKKSANQGYAQAEYDLGNMYAMGYVLERNYSNDLKAYAWLSLAIKQGKSNATLIKLKKGMSNDEIQQGEYLTKELLTRIHKAK